MTGILKVGLVLEMNLSTVTYFTKYTYWISQFHSRLTLQLRVHTLILHPSQSQVLLSSVELSKLKSKRFWEFPGSVVNRTPRFQCQGFNPRSGTKIPQAGCGLGKIKRK